MPLSFIDHEIKWLVQDGISSCCALLPWRCRFERLARGAEHGAVRGGSEPGAHRTMLSFVIEPADVVQERLCALLGRCMRMGLASIAESWRSDISPGNRVSVGL